MEYVSKLVKCAKPGLSQEAALKSLYDSKKFKPGSRVASIKQSGPYWIATLEIPKVAAPPPFPPKDDEELDEPKPEGPPGDDLEGEAPPLPEDKEAPEGEKEEGKPKSEKAELAELTSLVHAIAEKLGIPADIGGPGADDPLAPEGDLPLPPPPGAGPDGPPPGPKGPPAKKPKIGPHDTPPGVTPINTPAFASAQEPPHPLVGKVASFVATEDAGDMTIKQANQELSDLFGPWGYKVKQIQRDDGKLKALLSVR